MKDFGLLKACQQMREELELSATTLVERGGRFEGLSLRAALNKLVPGFDKHGDAYFPSDPFMETVHIMRGDYHALIRSLESQKLDTSRLRKAIQAFVSAYKAAQLADFPLRAIARQEVLDCMSADKTGIDFSTLTDPDALGPFLRKEIFRDGLSGGSPLSKFRMLASLMVVLNAELNPRKKGFLSAKSDDIQRARLLTAVVGAYHGHICDANGETFRYVRHITSIGSIGIEYRFTQYRRTLHEYLHSKSRRSLTKLIEHELRGDCELRGYATARPLIHFTYIASVARREGAPLSARTPGYGLSFEQGYATLMNDAGEQASALGVHGFVSYARHLSACGLHDKARDVLDSYPKAWTKTGNSLGAIQKIALLDGYAQTHHDEYRASKKRYFLDAAELKTLQALELCRKIGINKKIEEFEVKLRQIEQINRLW